jgi:uncharacterized glyoxalase superfamily protein PhnB
MATLSRIAPEVPAHDINEAIAYYTQRLGFELAMRMADEYAIVERDGIAIHLFSEHPGKFAPAGLHIFTQQLDELHAELNRRGAIISAPITLRPWGNRDFRVSDSAGNTLKFTEAA